MSPALNGSSAIRHFEGSEVIEIHDGITFDFYTGLPHIYMSVKKIIEFDLTQEMSSQLQSGFIQFQEVAHGFAMVKGYIP